MAADVVDIVMVQILQLVFIPAQIVWYAHHGVICTRFSRLYSAKFLPVTKHKSQLMLFVTERDHAHQQADYHVINSIARRTNTVHSASPHAATAQIAARGIIVPHQVSSSVVDIAE